MEISIIIPVYNREKTIEKCIKSLLCQLDDNCEIIMVDDGSCDNTIELCQNLLSDNVKLIKQEHGGVSIARNNGIANATGKYITFIDSDDYVGDDYISRLKAAITGEPEFVVFDSFNFQIDGNIIKRSAGIKSAENADADTIYPFLISQKINNVWLKIFRADIIQNNNIKFTAGMIISEDYMFIIDYLNACNSIKVCDYLPYYFIYNTSGTYNVNHHHLLNLMTSYENTITFISANCSDIDKTPMQARFIQQCVEVCGKLYEKKQMSAELNYKLISSELYNNLIKADYPKLKSRIEKFILKKKNWAIAKYYFHTVKLLEKIKNYV